MTELGFPHLYDCQVLHEIPATAARRFYYPGAAIGGGRDGIGVRVQPNDALDWIGIFAFGELGGTPSVS